MRDEYGNLEKLFWCDGISRTDYKAFGHVLAFDTTYKCNAYNKPFVVLVGVNHHRNTVLFGCALVVHEKEDTYIWVLQQLIAAGDDYKPLTVITDRDKAMANAISQVLPEAKHRLCLWHIMRNVKSNGNKSFDDGFMRCADKCRTPMDFEQAWKELVDKHEVEGKVWVQDLYGVKEKWAEAYTQGNFYAGMRTTQWCESMNKALKALLDKKVMMYRFVECYHKELQSLRWKEGHQDYKTMDEQPYCDGVLATLKSNAAKVYMRNVFSTLCKEISWSLGFPCRHMFVVLKYEKEKEIPRGCIMKQWTIYAKEDGLEKKDECVESDNPITVQAKYSNLASYCMNICHRASQTLKTFNEVKDQFAKMSLKLQAEKVGSKNRTTKNKELLGIGDPIVVETGRGKPKKIKRQASSFNPTHVPYDEDDEDVTLDLHKTFESALNKHCDQDMKHTNALQISNLAGYMPKTYKKDGISKVIKYEIY
ncbi:hypothetical protein GQ457_06G008500 [Hibiscus cannabinus]